VSPTAVLLPCPGSNPGSSVVRPLVQSLYPLSYTEDTQQDAEIKTVHRCHQQRAHVPANGARGVEFGALDLTLQADPHSASVPLTGSVLHISVSVSSVLKISFDRSVPLSPIPVAARSNA
jgi:hypothetical protein